MPLLTKQLRIYLPVKKVLSHLVNLHGLFPAQILNLTLSIWLKIRHLWLLNMVIFLHTEPVKYLILDTVDEINSC
jgi:hypothetical protein